MVKFNALQTESMYVTRENINTYPDFTFEQQCITKTNQHKHLGLTLSKDLTWKSHLLSICQKATKRVDMLKALRYKLNRKTLETIYLSFVRPLLEYADVVWDNAPRHEKFYLDLEKLQIDAMRTICGCNNYSSKLLLYIDTNLQPLSIRRKFHRLVPFFKIKKQSLC